jgi:hypothetical protein
MGAYFDTLKILTFALIFITLVTIPNMYIYQTGRGIKYDIMGFITQYSLGNMGGSEGYCKQFPVTVTDVSFECNTGAINTTHQDPEIGIIAKGSE